VSAPAIELRCGDYRTALADVGDVDCLIVDAPYSDRTHAANDARLEEVQRPLSYAAFTESDVVDLVTCWSARVRGWFVSLTDHVLAPIWERELKAAGRYVFSPIACVEPGSRVRQLGDGPSQWSCFAIASRPRRAPYSDWGALPGAYVLPPGQREQRGSGCNHIGGKQLWLMRSLVRDYSRPGDRIVDPCAGFGSTLIAAAVEGRRGLGAEIDATTFAKAQARIAKGWTPTLFQDRPQVATQPELFADYTPEQPRLPPPEAMHGFADEFGGSDYPEEA